VHCSTHRRSCPTESASQMVHNTCHELQSRSSLPARTFKGVGSNSIGLHMPTPRFHLWFKQSRTAYAISVNPRSSTKAYAEIVKVSNRNAMSRTEKTARPVTFHASVFITQAAATQCQRVQSHQCRAAHRTSATLRDNQSHDD
jgi:hypothetical protein